MIESWMAGATNRCIIAKPSTKARIARRAARYVHRRADQMLLALLAALETREACTSKEQL
jgi:hypothetical protein